MSDTERQNKWTPSDARAAPSGTEASGVAARAGDAALATASSIVGLLRRYKLGPGQPLEVEEQRGPRLIGTGSLTDVETTDSGATDDGATDDGASGGRAYGDLHSE